MKKMFCTVLVICLLLTLLPTVSMAEAVEDWQVIGSWYGQYTGWSGNDTNYIQRYMNMKIESCDQYGNLRGIASVTTVEGQGEDNWIRYEFKGTIDFKTGKFFMQGTKNLASSNSNWSFAAFYGELNGDTIAGTCDNNPERAFSFGRVSEWAKDEITEANARGLIPETMKGKDMSRPVSRAEFAAVSLALYEALTGEKETAVPTVPFIDIRGCDDEQAIKKAYGLNIVAGISATEFAPNTSISRQDLAAMLCRAIKKYKFDEWTLATDSEYYLDSEGVKKYADDADISEYAKPSVYYLTKMGVLNGVDATHFAPKNTTQEQEAQGYATATREQAIALSLRIYKLSDLWKK